MLKRNMIIKLSKKLLERVRPQTEADSKLQLKLQRQAPTCGNAMLAEVLFIGLQSPKIHTFHNIPNNIQTF